MLKVWWMRLALLAAGAFSGGVNAETARVCSDVPPPPGIFSCPEQAQWNKCGESWMEDYCAFSCGRCEEPSVPACPGQKPEAPEQPSQAYGRYQDLPWMSVSEWCRRFTQNLKNPARGAAELVFLGDSITEAWPTRGAKVWQETFSRYKPLFLGIGGDQTQQLLWRIENGELKGLKPRVLVLLIGVNNIGWGNWAEAETAQGVEAVLRKLHERLPETTILHLGIFPANERPEDAFRLKIQNTNAKLAAIRIPNVRFLDIGARFLNPDGSISQQVMYDYLHPDEAGYRIWAQALQPELARIFGN